MRRISCQWKNLLSCPIILRGITPTQGNTRKLDALTGVSAIGVV